MKSSVSGISGTIYFKSGISTVSLDMPAPAQQIQTRDHAATKGRKFTLFFVLIYSGCAYTPHFLRLHDDTVYFDNH